MLVAAGLMLVEPGILWVLIAVFAASLVPIALLVVLVGGYRLLLRQLRRMADRRRQ